MLVDVTNTLHQPYTTGIQRVVRELAATAVERGAGLVEFSAATGQWHEVDPLRLRVLQERSPRRTAAFVGRRAYRQVLRAPMTARLAGSLVESHQTVYEGARRLLGGQPLGLGPATDVRARLLVLPEITSTRAHARAIAQHVEGDGFRFVAFLHDTLPQTHPEWFPPDPRHHFDDYLATLARASRIAAASHHMEAEAREILAAGPARCERFPLPATRSERREPPAAGEPLFVMVGSLEPRKNHVSVLQAALALHREGVPLKLVFVGQTGWGNGTVRAAIADARRAGLHLVERRSATDKELAGWYRRATAIVYPSLAEGYGLPVVEALAAGTPVITSRRPALEEFAALGGVRLVEPTDVGELADAMRGLIDPVAWRETAAAIDTARVPVGWAPWAGAVLDWMAA